jgi:hypothetical protein
MEGFQQKSLSDFEMKGAEGIFRATIATFNTVDLDGDVTFPGAFPVGKHLIVGGYNHSSMPPINALPTGKAVIGADEHRAWIDGQFFMDTPHGKAMYDTVKSLGAVAEWSYFYLPPKTAPRADFVKVFPTARRGLIGLEPIEASAVIKGAGIGTGTDFIKSADFSEEKVLALFDELGGLFGFKAGRTLSAASRARLLAIHGELQKFLDETDPQSDSEVIKALNFEPMPGFFDLDLALAKSRGGFRS